MIGYIDNNFYCIDIGFNAIWVACFSINSNRAIDIQFIRRRSISSLFLDGKINISYLEKEIKKVISVIEKEIGETIYSIYLTSDLLSIASQMRQIYINIGINKQVTNKHIQKSLVLLKDDININDQCVLHVIPIRYNIDVGEVDNPVGYKTQDLRTTYNIITSDNYILTSIRNIFDKYQIEVNDIISHNYLLSRFCVTGSEKSLPTLFIEISYIMINIGFVYRGKLMKCICIQNEDIVRDYNSKNNIYNVFQFIKNSLPENILNIIKYVVIYSSFKPDANIIYTTSDIFGVNCDMLSKDLKNSSPIFYLINYLSEQIIDEHDYFNISNKKLTVFSKLKDIITDTL